MTRDEFISGMHVMNECLNLADKCQPVLMQYLSEQPTPLHQMNALDFIGVEPNIVMILQPVIEKIEALRNTEVYKRVIAEPKSYVPGLVIPE
jgi:hypothetical protein